MTSPEPTVSDIARVRAGRRPFAIALLAATAASAGVGCQAKVLRPTEADAFRAREATLRAELEASQRRVSELETKLAAAEARSAPGGSLDAEAAAALPALSRVAVSSLSSARRTGPRSAQLDLVLEPEDALGRFLQLTGTLEVQAVVLIPGSESPATASRTVRPAELRGFYRSGLLGTHYTVPVSIEWSAEPGGEPRAVSVAAEFTDALSGRAFPAVGTVTILPERKASKPADGQPSAESR